MKRHKRKHRHLGGTTKCGRFVPVFYTEFHWRGVTCRNCLRTRKR